ncbi:MAG: methyltransferase domain-containing protein [Casimicrobiaceae bacterium]
MVWNPQQYLKFGSERLRPARDLLAQVLLEAPTAVADLGCGTATVTALIRERWPRAMLTGVDNSPTMLEGARAALPDVTFVNADLGRWQPSAPLDLLVSNAALHWLDDHGTLFPRLVSFLHPGGVLAVQMPAQHEGPSHRLGYELADSPPFRARLGPLVRRRPILDAAAYHRMLRPLASSLDLWFTEYVHVLAGDDPIAEFTKGSLVGAWLAALPAEDAAAFEATYRERVRAAYPPQDDGTTLFPFRRFFLVLQR